MHTFTDETSGGMRIEGGDGWQLDIDAVRAWVS